MLCKAWLLAWLSARIHNNDSPTRDDYYTQTTLCRYLTWIAQSLWCSDLLLTMIDIHGCHSETTFKSVVLWWKNIILFFLQLLRESNLLNSYNQEWQIINPHLNQLQRWIPPLVKGSDHVNVDNSQLKAHVCHKWITADGVIAHPSLRDEAPLMSQAPWRPTGLDA